MRYRSSLAVIFILGIVLIDMTGGSMATLLPILHPYLDPSCSKCLGDEPPSSDVPSALHEIAEATPKEYLRRVKDIPIAARRAFAEVMSAKDFNMADYRGAWNKTDYVQDASLPFRRLIWAVTIKDYYIIHYEKGGFGYSTHYLVAAPDRNTKKWKVLWAGVAFERGQDYPAFISALKKRKLDSNPSLGH